MKVLWVCNTMLPLAAEYLNREVGNKEGWIAGLAEKILRSSGEDALELAYACPVDRVENQKKLLIPGKSGMRPFTLYVFEENTGHPECYTDELAGRLGEILSDFEPDIIHCFGTEFPHTLALTKVCEKEKLLVGIQGVCEKCEEAYYADLPEYVIKRTTFRDLVKKDSIPQQKEKFAARSRWEVAALKEILHVTGRTEMDREFVCRHNPAIKYHFMNETLRGTFYEGVWDRDHCERHSILISQGDYPLKGLHYLLKAMPVILEKYPDAKVYVAGNPIVRPKTFKGMLKVSSYGKYIMELIGCLKLEESIFFTGKLNAREMKERMLHSHVFVCASSVENSPNSLGEAMLLGVPCVTSWVGGIPSMFISGADGISYPGYGAVEYRDAEDKEQAQAIQLGKAILQMFDNEEKMLEYGKCASAHAGRTHNGQRNYERLLEIYREIAGK